MLTLYSERRVVIDAPNRSWTTCLIIYTMLQCNINLTTRCNRILYNSNMQLNFPKSIWVSTLMMSSIWPVKETNFEYNQISTYLCKSRALNVLDCLQFLCKLLTLFQWNGFLLYFSQLFQSSWIISQVYLGSNQQKWSLLLMMRYFWNPLKRRKFEFSVIIILQKQKCLRYNKWINDLLFPWRFQRNWDSLRWSKQEKHLFAGNLVVWVYHNLLGLIKHTKIML